MSIERMDIHTLREMRGTRKEGLVLQGCGGDLQEWQDGVNGMLADDGILLEGTRFERIYVFQHESRQNLLFLFDDAVKLDVGKLAIWRLRNLNLEGMWLSDYVDNRLGGEIDITAPFEDNQMEEGMDMQV